MLEKGKGLQNELGSRILELIIEVTGEPALADERDVDLVDAGLLDSMASVELMVNLEDEFAIVIPPTALDEQAMNTVNGIITQVSALIKKNSTKVAQ